LPLWEFCILGLQIRVFLQIGLVGVCFQWGKSNFAEKGLWESVYEFPNFQNWGERWGILWIERVLFSFFLGLGFGFLDFAKLLLLIICLLIGSFIALFYCNFSPFSLLFDKVREMRGNGVLNYITIVYEIFFF